MTNVEFHFDFGSPNAHLAHLIVPQIEQRTGVKFKYVPVLLGGVFKLTNNRSPAVSMLGIKNRLEYEELERRRFVRQHNITRFTWNPFFIVNTLFIMRGAIAAEIEGVFERYVDEVFRHMWAEPKKMDDPEVVRAALDQLCSLGFGSPTLRTVFCGTRKLQSRAARLAVRLSSSATRSSSARIGCATSSKR
jgi:2-hydroxychromene-2-carboxylate isomerase